MNARLYKMPDETWEVRFYSPADGRRRSLRVGRYKPQAEIIAARIDRLIGSIKAQEPVPADVAAWLATLPASMPAWWKKFAEWKMIPESQLARLTPLEECIRSFGDSFGTSPDQVNRAGYVLRRLHTVFRLGNIASLPDIQPSAVERALALMSKDGWGPNRKAAAPHTLRVHSQAVGQFCRWAVREKMLATFPLIGLNEIRGGTLTKRRALTHDEQRWLLAVTASRGPFIASNTSIPAADRVMLYRTVIETGLRGAELDRLKVGAFALDSKPPMLLISEAGTKNRRAAAIPLRASFAAKLRTYLRFKTAESPAFSMPVKYDRADMLRADLAAARSAWIDAATGSDDREARQRSYFLRSEDERGSVVDFHALRHTAISNRAKAGESLAAVSKFARHSQLDLTLRVYIDLGLTENPGEIIPLPDFDAWESQALAATGTDGNPAEWSLRLADPCCNEQSPQKSVVESGRSGSSCPSVSTTRAATIDGPTVENPFFYSVDWTNCAALCSSDQSHFRDLNPGPMLYEMSGSRLAASTCDTGTTETGTAATAPADPDLAALVQLWPNLPPAIRLGILGMARATAASI